MSANSVPGRYWNVSGEIVIAPSAASAKRFAKGARNIRGALSSLRARLATAQEISDYIAKEPERVAANDRARQEHEAKERLSAAAPDLLSALRIALLKWEHPNAIGAEAWQEWGAYARAAIAKVEGGGS